MKNLTFAIANKASLPIIIGTIFIALSSASVYASPPPHSDEQGPPAHSREQGPPPHANNEKTDQPSHQTASDKCQQRQLRAVQARERFISQVKRHLTVFDSIHERVQSFHDNNQLSDPDYEELNSAVSLAQQNTVDTLTSFSQPDNATVDCSDESLSSANIKTMRQEATGVIDSLKTYRSSLVLLIHSLRAEITDENHTSNSPAGDDQSSDSSTNTESDR